MINLNNLDSSFNEIPTITLNDYRKAAVYANTEAEARFTSNARRCRRDRYYENVRHELNRTPIRKPVENPRYAIVEFTENAGTRNYPDIFTYCDIVELVATSKNHKLVKIDYTPKVVGEHGYCNHKTAYARNILAWVK